MPAGLRRHPDHVHVVLDRLARDLFRRLEERPHVDVEPEIGERRRDHLGAAVVPVLPDLRDEHARPAAVLLGEALDLLSQRLPLGVIAVGRAVDAADRADLRVIPPPHLLHRVRDLADRGAGPRCFDRELEEIPAAAFRGGGQRAQRRFDLLRIAGLTDLLQARDLCLAHGAVVDLAGVDLGLFVEAELVDADDDVLAAIDPRLAPRGGLLDPQLRHPGLDRLRHPAHPLDFLDDAERLRGEGVRQRLHEVRPAPRVDDLRNPRLELQDQLRVARDASRRIRRQRDRFVEGVRVQRLRAAEHGGHSLDGGADDVVERVLLGEARPRRLAMRPQHQRRLLLRREVLLHQRRPEESRGAELRDLHVEVHSDREEERQPPGELVDVEALRQRRAHVLEAIGDRERELEVARRAGFLHVVAADRDRVELGHLATGVLDDVRTDPHARLRRIDVRVADHELLQDVVLDGAGELRARDALLLTGDDEAREHRQHGAVHRHRHRHLVERHAVEEDLHVLDGVDRDPRLADVADDTRMIRVVAAVGGEVEGDREPHLPGGEVGAIEGVRLLRGREARVLPDRPRLPGVHRRARATDERERAGGGVGEVEIGDVGRGVERLHVDALGRLPHET